MKAIRLRTVSPGPNTIVEGDLEWADMVKQVVRQPTDPTKGIEIEEMRKSIRVLDALEKSNGVLELEDADWEHLKAKVIGMKWAVVDGRIVQFVDEVITATDKPLI